MYLMICCYVFLQGNNTPLHLASRHGHAAVVDLLIGKGAAIDQTNDVSQQITICCLYVRTY